MVSWRDIVMGTNAVLLLLSFLGLPLACRGEVVSVGLTSDPFQKAADFLRSVDDEIFGTFIDGNQIQLMVDLFLERTSCRDVANGDTCYKCLSMEGLLPFLGVSATGADGLVMRDAEELGRASLVLVYLELNSDITADCNSSADGVNSTSYEDIVDAVLQMGTEGDIDITQQGESFALRQLEWIIEQLNATYQPLSQFECFTGETLFEDAGIPTKTADRSELEMLFAHLINRMLRGHCIGESELVEPSFFIDDLFITYGNVDSVVMMEGFVNLLKDIGLFGRHVPDREVESNHTQTPIIPDVTTTHFPTVVTTPSTPNVTLATGNVTDTPTVLPPNATVPMPNATTSKPNATNSMPNATTPVPNVNASMPNVTVPLSGGNQPPRRLEANRHVRSANEMTEEHHLKKKKRSVVLEATYDGNRCFTADELFAIFNVDPEVGVERENFARLCPALIQQLSVKSCQEVHQEKTPIANVYLWGTLAVLIISLCSLLAVLIIPCAGASIFNVLMHFLIALSISTLSGDALFHLLPEAMELHGHGENGTVPISLDHDSFIYKLIAAVGTIYVCFIVEKIFKMVSRNSEKQSGPHDFDDNGLNGYTMDGAMMNTSENNQNENQHKRMDELLMEPLKEDKPCCSCKGLNSSSAIVLIGDTVHNFMDGLAIGVAFTADFYVGVSTSVAILCHEVPHELSDFAVLLRNGMNKKIALFWNFLSALFAFLGLYVGINIALSETFHPWIFAVTAGLFLYISLVDLTRTLLEVPPHNFVKSGGTDDNPLDEENYHRGSDEDAVDDGCSCCVFIVQNVALFLGWALTLALALYEDQMVHLF